MVNNILGKRIELLRTELGLNQMDLAKKLNLASSASISQYESGERTPNDDIKLKISELFNVSLDYLMGKSDIRNYEELKSNFNFEFSKELEGLSNEEISNALKFYKEMKKKIKEENEINTVNQKRAEQSA